MITILIPIRNEHENLEEIETVFRKSFNNNEHYEDLIDLYVEVMFNFLKNNVAILIYVKDNTSL